MKRLLLVSTLAVFSLACAVPVSGQWGRHDTRYGYGSSVDRIAYDNGLREGRREGERDGRRGARFRYEDASAYRRGDLGYRREYGNVNRYRQAFREGFASGYADGYRRYSRGGVYPPSGSGRYTTAFDIGARDGFEKGREDARDGDRFDPRRHKWYREGDRNYNSRYGPRERYKDEYRRGFLAGYERGYREWRR
ncbi:MAG TPA: hypothetical protein VGD94_19175 [Vicinamibacterales bacterium]